MARLFYFFSIVVLCHALTACSTVKVPQLGAVAPCQIQSMSQVEQAIQDALRTQHWTLLYSHLQMLRASKKSNSMDATIDIAYGYRGFSIEYMDSHGMEYDPENNTINPTYKKWAYHLMETIQKNLENEAKKNPHIKCFGKDSQN